jgi:hypothetical protein
VKGRPALRGGLLLNRSVRLYLAQGEPDLWLPESLSPARPVAVDGRALKEEGSLRIQLAQLGLPEGHHLVAVEGQSTFEFQTAKSLGSMMSAACGSIAQNVDVATRAEEGAFEQGSQAENAAKGNSVSVAGARILSVRTGLPRSVQVVLLPLNALEYVILGSRPGEILFPHCPQRPSWMDRVEGGGLFPYGFEVCPPFEPVWLVTRNRKGAIVRAGRLSEPSPSPASDASDKQVAAWYSAFLSLPQPAQPELATLWDEYFSVARKHLESSE